MKSRIRSAYALLITGLLAGAGPSAQAACTQADATGTWYTFNTTSVYGFDWDGDGSPEFEVTLPYRCKVVIGSTGKFSPTTSWCKLPDGTPLDTRSGTVKVASSCAVTISGPPGASAVGQVARDKFTFHGIGSVDGEWRTVTAVKK